MARAALLNASQCVAYDTLKHSVINDYAWTDGPLTHFMCSMVTGVITTTVTNPLDVVKNMVFVSGSKRLGPLQCTADVLREEGLRGFFKGWYVWNQGLRDPV